MFNGKLPVPGRPTNLDLGQGPSSLAVGADGGCLGIFFLSFVISLFFLPLSCCCYIVVFRSR